MMNDEHYCDCCGHVHGDLEAHEKITKLEAELEMYERDETFGTLAIQLTQIESTNAALLDVVRDCVNFLADLNSTSPFDSEYMVQRAKSLHKRAYTAHSKAKGE